MTTRDKSDRLHQKIYDFLLYIYPLLSKYPKYEKFSLQTATRNAILEMLQEVQIPAHLTTHSAKS